MVFSLMVYDLSFSELSSSRISAMPNQLTDNQEGERCPDTSIWVAVITQALMDAGSNSNKPEMKK